jgi:hypothetical protein
VVALLAAVAALGSVAFKSWIEPPAAGAGTSYGVAAPAAAPALSGEQASSPQVAAPAATALPAGAFDRLSFPALSPDSSLSPGSSLKGGAVVRPCSECASGKAVDVGAGSLTLQVAVPVEGDYSIGVYYVAATAAAIGVSVNGGAGQPLALEPSYDVQNPNRGSYVSAHLHAGTNTVQLSGAAASAPSAAPSPSAAVPSPGAAASGPTAAPSGPSAAASGPSAAASGPSAAASGPLIDRITVQLARA